jgi:hypothetical protein
MSSTAVSGTALRHRVLTHLVEFGGEHALPVYFDPQRRRVMVCCDKFLELDAFGEFGEVFRMPMLLLFLCTRRRFF